MATNSIGANKVSNSVPVTADLKKELERLAGECEPPMAVSAYCAEVLEKAVEANCKFITTNRMVPPDVPGWNSDRHKPKSEAPTTARNDAKATLKRGPSKP